MINRTTIEFQNSPQSLNWLEGDLVDWVHGGNKYSLNGGFQSSQVLFSYEFDSAIQSDHGVYAVIYEKLGTKGLLLKNGQILRELNRSSYCADAYEYPITFIKLSTDEYAIAHCPDEYCRIEFDLVESGKRLTNKQERKLEDCFHSRFRVNPSNTFLLNTGWVWHPYNMIDIYDIEKSLIDNTILDVYYSPFPISCEVNTAEFLNDDLIVINSTDDEPLDEEALNDKVNLQSNQIGLYVISENRFKKKVQLDQKSGTLIPINEDFVIDLYDYPKLINLNTGKIIQEFKDINSGQQNSSIIHHIEPVPPMAFDRTNKRLAIANGQKIEVLTFVEP